MKLKLYYYLIVLLTVLSFAGYLSTRQVQPQKISLNKQQTATLPLADKKLVDPSISSFIEQHEYYIKNNAGTYTSPNRKQNTRAVYHADGFEITPRKEEGQSWHLKLNLAGINKGGKDLANSATPEFKINKNTLHVQHEDYTIEYINDKNGTRQNFLIQTKPAGDEPLKVLLQPHGSITLKDITPTNATFGDEEGIKLSYQDLKVWDAAGNILPAKMQEENNMLAIVVQDKNATYPVTVDPLATTPTQTLLGLQLDDQMGYSIASAGDINNDGFGDMIVGAIMYDNGHTNEGAAFIYYGSSTGLAATPDVILESNGNNLRFGYSLAAADFNNDNFSDVVVGAPQYTNGAGEAYEGAVYIYYGSASGPINTPTILEGGRGGARMGTSVAVGDLDGNGIPDIASGALGFNNMGALYNGQGGVYVFYGISSGFNTTPVMLVPALQGGVTFGGSITGVSIGNFNGDTYQDLVVGAHGYDEGLTNQGAVYLYLGSSTGVPTTYSKLFTSGQANAYLGSSVAFAGDLNKDGYDDIAAGAPYYTGTLNREGAVFVYYGTTESSTNTQIVLSTIADTYMGTVVTGGGDLDGDGFDDLAAGAYNYAFDPDTRGGVFVFGGSSTGLQTTPMFTRQENVTNIIGSSLAFARNINGANGLHLAVGMPNYTGGVYENASIALYAGEPNTLPVTLNQFNAKLLNNGEVEITWDTYSEQMNSHFEVLRSSNGTQFSFLGRVNGQLNANSHSFYKLIDKSPHSGNNFYRLVQYDVDGASKILGTTMVAVGASNINLEVYPNPTADFVNINFRGQEYKKAELVDLAGRVFYSQKPTTTGIFSFNLSGLGKGVYIIRLYSNDGNIISKQVVKK